MEQPKPLTLTISRRLVCTLIIIPIVAVVIAGSFIFPFPTAKTIVVSILIILMVIVGCRFMFNMKNKKLVIDERGIIAKDFQVSWGEVTSCKYEYSITLIRGIPDRQRILIINTKTKGARRYKEKLNGYGYNKYELARAIDENAGRKIFKLKKSLLQERHEWAEKFFSPLITSQIMLPMVIASVLLNHPVVMLLILIIISIPLSNFIDKKYMKWWNRRNGYKE